jgi:hypothetical protein
MALDLWFRDDVARILQATHETMCSTAAVVGQGAAGDAGGRERAAGYRQGFGAALRAVATAFGVTDSTPGGSPDRWRPVAAPEMAASRMVIDGEMGSALGSGNHNPQPASPRSPEGDLRGLASHKGHVGLGKAWD